jgi:hypothetical protein
MDFWEKVKRDFQKGIKEGIGIVSEGVTVVKQKADELTEEGKRRLKLFELQTKVQKETAELGGKVYGLSSKMKNPMLDSKVKTIVSRLKKIETEMAKLEGRKTAAPSKAKAKHTTKSKKK